MGDGRGTTGGAASDEDHEQAQGDDLLRDFAGSTTVGFYIRAVDPPEFLYLNEGLRQILGLASDDPDPSFVDLLAAIHPDDRSWISAAAAASHANRARQTELRLCRPDGAVRWVRISSNPVDNPGAAPVRSIGTVEDITEQKLGEAALRESQLRFEQLADNVAVGFTLFSMTGAPEFIYGNRAYREIVGLDRDTPLPALAELLRQRLGPADLARGPAAAAQLRRGEEVDEELRIFLPDGRVRWIRSRRSPVLDADGNLVRAAGTTEDITERKTAEAAARSARIEAERANAAKNEFLSRMSHELRTPLNAILGFAQLLEMDDLSATQLESVGYILRGGRHLLAMINDVLDITGIEADKLEMSVEPVHVGTVISDALSLTQPLARGLSIPIVFDATQPGADRYVRADQRRIRQVLINLLSNAVKYNKPGGNVTIRCSADDASVRIAVEDTGQGIGAANMARLFTPFDRLGQQASTIEGSGIGLALSQRLVGTMAGRLEAESTQGVGSTFTIVMPSAVPLDLPSAEGASQTPDGAAAAPRDGTLLYIEDNLSNLRLMERIVHRRPGWSLIHAVDGAAGVQLAGSHQPSLIMLDLHLPDMDGIDVLHALRRGANTATIPVVVASADASPGQIARLLAAGVQNYVTKPLVVDDVFKLLDQYAASI